MEMRDAAKEEPLKEGRKAEDGRGREGGHLTARPQFDGEETF